MITHPETDALYLLIDQGGHSSRALVLDAAGRILARAQSTVTLTRPAPGRAEYDPPELLDSVRQALQRVAAALGPRSSAVAAAALAVQRSSVVCWDRENGRALSPVLSWLDRRGAAALEGLDPQRVREITGLRRSPHYGAGKLAWCLRHLPGVTEAAAAGRLVCGPLASFLAYHLCSERPLLTEPGLACRMLLADYRRREWDAALVQTLGLPPACLPRIVPSDHVWGSMAFAGRGLPLRLLLGDQPASLFAAGPPDPARIHVNAGSGAFLQRVFDTPPRPQGGLLAAPAASPDTTHMYTLEGTVNGAANAFDWFDRRQGYATDWPALLQQPLSDPGPVRFLNGVGGLGSPWWQPDFVSRFTGTQAGEVSKAQRAQALIESILFLLRVNLDRLAAAGPAPRELLLSGGLSRSDGLCQWLADLAGLPVLRLDEPEATALGLFQLLRPDGPVAQPLQRFTPRADNPVRARYVDWLAQMPPLPPED